MAVGFMFLVDCAVCVIPECFSRGSKLSYGFPLKAAGMTILKSKF
jgi:hypothetical protein